MKMKGTNRWPRLCITHAPKTNTGSNKSKHRHGHAHTETWPQKQNGMIMNDLDRLPKGGWLVTVLYDELSEDMPYERQGAGLHLENHTCTKARTQKIIAKIHVQKTIIVFFNPDCCDVCSSFARKAWCSVLSQRMALEAALLHTWREVVFCPPLPFVTMVNGAHSWPQPTVWHPHRVLIEQ